MCWYGQTWKHSVDPNQMLQTVASFYWTQGSGKKENSRSGPKIRILDRFQTPQNANNSVQQVCALNPIFSPTNQFSGINDV